MRTPLGLIVAALSVISTNAAFADELDSTLGEPLFEASHSVDVTIKDGIAVYQVRRVFANPGTIADEARLEIDLPYGAAATGLRIRARSQWFDGELMEAEKAAQLYQELTGKGIWKPKDPALLYWRWADKLALQVFPVLPGSTSTVEYTLTVPTRYSGGRVFLSYPRQSADVAPNLATPVLRVRPAWADATTMMKVDGVRSATDAPIVLRPPVVPAWLEAIPHEDSASYVASTIEVKDTPATRAIFATAKLTIDIEHTYRSDLRVALYTPANVRVDVFDGSGGGDNDVRGTFDIELPAKTAGVGVWRLVVSDHAALDAGSLERWTLQLGDGRVVKLAAADTPVFVPDAPENASDGGVAMIELAPPAIDVVSARLGKVVASPRHAFGRLELDAAPQLRPLPRAAQVVFVVDASHSMGRDNGVAMQLQVVRAYLSHLPDAQVEVVLYRRRATRLFGAFVPATEIDARLQAAADAGKLAPGNGSALDEGAKLATAAIAGRKGPLRVVVTTDNLLRDRFTSKDALTALAKLPAAAVVHIVDADPRRGGEPTLVRDDDHALAGIALAHRGIGARLEGASSLGKELPRLVLGLVRPVRIDHFAIKGFDLEKGRYDQTLPEVLDEGAGLRVVVAHTAAPSSVELSGMIWGDRFRRTVAVNRLFSLATAGWVFSEDDHQDLSPEEMMKVAMMGKAVSPVTSYLAIEPGTRPSPIGIEGRGGMRGNRSAVPSVRIGSASAMGRKKPDPTTLLADAAKACVARHRPAAGWSVTLALESTYDEVVDVYPTAGDKLPIAACLVEAVWALRLPRKDYTLAREAFTLAFR